MAYELTEKLQREFEGLEAEAVQILRELCAIEAPSHSEDKRAAYVLNYMKSIGATEAYIDSVKNVIYKMEGSESDDAVVFMAHTDTVFPFGTPLNFREDGENYYCPSVGDDTASLSIMLTVLKKLIAMGAKPRRTVLFVANSCEEGLGNLKGSKQIVSDFGAVLKEFYTFDGKYSAIVNKCVGSHRYSIECTTEGGHSFGAFGNANAIAELSVLITELYKLPVPKKEGTKTTYNVGIIEGGTSVNTIAQQAKMLYEYRSDDRECLAEMEKQFKETLERVRSESRGSFTLETVGIRPCDGEIDRDLLRSMTDTCKAICQKYSGIPCEEKSGSTDCNSSSAAGIAAVCVGAYMGGGAHTREEWVVKNSIPVGLKICAEIILDAFERI